MAAFSYRARDRAGLMVRGRVEAGDSREALARLRAQGLLVLELAADRDLGHMVARQGWSLQRRPGAGDLALFCRQLATMLAAGLPVLSALEILARQARGARLRRALAQALADIENGEGLSSALGRTGAFPPVLIHLVAAGEVGGTLDQVLDRLAAQLEREEAVRQKVRSALSYPLVVSGLAVLIVAFLVVFVMPRFAAFFTDMGAPLPGPTRLLLALSSWVGRWWWLGLLAAAGAGVVLARLLRTPAGRLAMERVWVRLPVIGPMTLKYNVSRFARTLAGLLGGGIPILKALAVAERVISLRLLGQVMLEALDAVRKGQSLAGALGRSPLLPPMLVEMIHVGEQSGTLDDMLQRCAQFYEDEVQRTAERLSSIIEPLLICGLALVVGGVVVALVLPIFDLWSLIG